jgi:hypothetical protein
MLAAMRRHEAFRRDPAAVRLHLPEREATTADGRPVADDGYVLELGTEGPRALLGRRLLAQRVARLATLLDEETQAVRDAGWIDLRYADRAVLGAGNGSTSG